MTVLDISHHQNDAGPIDWDKVLSGLAALYIKITERSDYVDPQWTVNYASSMGVPRGAYHFCGDSITGRYGDPVVEADHFADVYLSKPWQLRPAYDIEMAGATPGWLTAFRAQFRRRTGVTADRVYTSQSFITNALKPELWMGDLDTDLWIARYHPTLGFDHPKLKLWQFTRDGDWPGFSGLVDVDREMNDWQPSQDNSTSTAGLAALYEEDGYMPVDVKRGGAKDAPIKKVLAVSMLREHDVVIAPGDAPVVLYGSYHWDWTEPGTGGNPVADPRQPKVIGTHESFSYIVPKGTGKVDIRYWSDDDFSITVAPR
jgi:GH25 family lysozyme M1 (1,4-beta-N-acetylmuramidase)